MPLVSGSRLGAYEVLSPLGSSGMADLDRSLDTKLHREVALKLLSDRLGVTYAVEAAIRLRPDWAVVCNRPDGSSFRTGRV